MNRTYRKLPEIIQSILLISEGWLVGGAITSLLNEKEVKDYDIIVPSRELFQLSCKSIYGLSKNIEINSFGGIRATLPDGLVVDMWSEELDHFLKTANRVEYVYNMKRNILLKSEGE